VVVLVLSREVPLRFRVIKTFNAAAIEMLSFVAGRRPVYKNEESPVLGFTPGPGQYVVSAHTYRSLVARGQCPMDGFRRVRLLSVLSPSVTTWHLDVTTIE
jgi:hypothetical protein